VLPIEQTPPDADLDPTVEESLGHLPDLRPHFFFFLFFFFNFDYRAPRGTEPHVALQNWEGTRNVTTVRVTHFQHVSGRLSNESLAERLKSGKESG